MDDSGLTIIASEEALDRVEKRTTELRLVGKAANLELMHQRIREGTLFGLSPAGAGVPEGFYVISGECVHQSADGTVIRTLGPGACVTALDLNDSAYFKSLSALELLYISTQPIFSSLSEDIGELLDMARRVEEKDTSTAMHCERLQKYSALIGERLGLPPHRLEDLIHAAILHDIGKSTVPDHILSKPGPLDAEETATMRGHAAAGAELVARTYLKGTAKIIAQHHEWYNGQGYPAGIAWPELCIEAAIIACVDAYDAMTSDRPYRRAMEPAAAVQELQRGRGTQFHPVVVDALLEILVAEGVLPGKAHIRRRGLEVGTAGRPTSMAKN